MILQPEKKQTRLFQTLTDWLQRKLHTTSTLVSEPLLKDMIMTITDKYQEQELTVLMQTASIQLDKCTMPTAN